MRFAQRAAALVTLICLGTLALLTSSCANESKQAELVGFVELGSIRADFARARAAWLDSDEASTMAEVLEDAAAADDLDSDRLERALAALDQPPSEGTRGVAFILPGCADTGAKLKIDGPVISAELTESGGHTDCDAAVWFLTVFEVPTDEIPDSPRFET